MEYTQVRQPNPNVACTPGWCLLYVQDAFGLRPVDINLENSASKSWADSQHKHEDQDFPAGCWVPVWFSVSTTDEGHVVLRAPDGSIWSSSSPTSNIPVHHASLNALYAYYKSGGVTLTYLGWTEDVEGALVIQQGGNNMNEVQHWQAVAAARLNSLISIAQCVSVNYVDANSDPQVVANIKTEQARIDQLTTMVGQLQEQLTTPATGTDAQAKLDQIKTIIESARV